MRTFFIGILMLTASTLAANGQPRLTDEQLLRKLNWQYDRAIVENDVKTLDRLFHADFVYTNPDGEVRTREQQITFARSGDLQFETGASDDVRIKIYGNTAVMTGRFVAKGKFKGNDLAINERYTAVWVKSGGTWRLVAEQGNVIKQ